MKQTQDQKPGFITIRGKDYKKEWLDIEKIYEDNKDGLKCLVCIGENSLRQNLYNGELIYEISQRR